MAWTSKPPAGTPLKTGTWHTQNLVAFWSFQETSGTTLHDIYGGHDATLYNFADPPTSTSGWNTEAWGPVLAFDGTDDHCYTNSNFAIANPVTVAYWIKLNAVGYTHLMNRPTFDANYGFQIYAGSGKFSLRGSSSTAVTTADTFSPGWYHLVHVFNGSNGKIYVNAVEKASGTITAVNANNQTTLAIGRYHTSLGYYLSGRLDDIRIWNRVLSTDEIAELYNDRWGIFADPQLQIKSIAGIDTSDIKSIAGVDINNINRIVT